MPAPRIVLGIGNPQRGDDGVGWQVARLVGQQRLAAVEIGELEGEPASVLACLERVSAAWIVDACHSGDPAGTIYRFDVRQAPLPHAGAVSTHDMGLAEAIELGRALEQLPARCIVYSVAGHTFEAGSELSPPVTRAVAIVAARIIAELGAQSPNATLGLERA